MTNYWEIGVSVCIIVGGLFTAIGSYGLVKLPDLMTRLHAPTKATTMGVGAILLASIISAFVTTGRVSINELLIAFFLFLTAPISAHFITRTHLHMYCKNPEKDLPDTCCECGWSMFEDPVT